MIDDFLLTKEEINGFLELETGHSLNKKLKGMYLELEDRIKALETKQREEVPESIKELLSELSKKGAAIKGFERLMDKCKEAQ